MFHIIWGFERYGVYDNYLAYQLENAHYEFAMSTDGPNFWSGIIPKFSLLGMVLTASSMVALLCFAGYAVLFGVRMSSHYGFLVSLYRLIGLTITSGLVFGVAGLWQRAQHAY